MIIRKRLLLIAKISIIIGILIPTSLNFAQSPLQINNVPGSGGTNNSNQSSSSDKTFIYVAGGAILVGIVVYALLKEKKKDKESESDTTEAINDLNLRGFANYSNNINSELDKAKDTIPVNLFLGIKNESNFLSSKRYMLGVSVRF